MNEQIGKKEFKMWRNPNDKGKYCVLSLCNMKEKFMDYMNQVKNGHVFKVGGYSFHHKTPFHMYKYTGKNEDEADFFYLIQLLELFHFLTAMNNFTYL